MRMLLAQRLLGALPVLFGVSIVIFALIHLAPGDVTTALLGPQATERDRAELRHTLGLDQPLPVQYAQMARAHCRRRFRHLHRDAAPRARPRPAAFRQYARAGGVEPAARHGDRLRRRPRRGAASRIALRSLRHVPDPARRQRPAVLARPAPCASVRALGCAGCRFPACRTWPATAVSLDMLRHLVLPTVTTALAPAAIITRMARSSVIDVLGQTHVRVARAKGLPRGTLCVAT